MDDAGFTSGMAKAAAATAVLKRELDGLGGSAVRGLSSSSRDIDQVGTSSRSAGADIDKLSGRLALLTQAATALGPAIIPIGALAVPALAGMATQLGVVALAAGVTVTAFQGIGDAFKAVNEAQLEPTAANFEKARAALDALSPSAQAFVMQLQEMRPAFAAIRDAGTEALFPQLSESLVDLETVLPKVETLFGSFGNAAGEVAGMIGDSLAAGEWDEFINFLSSEAEPTMVAIGSTVGSLAAGMSELVMAMDPLSDGFTGWLQDAAQGFEDWATGLDQTEGFQEFVSYIRETGPQVAETLGALANAVLQIAEAAAPLGGPVLAAIEGFARAIAAVADSPFGPALMATATAISAISLASRAAQFGVSKFSGELTNMQKVGLAVGGIELVVAGIKAIHEATNESLPGVETLTGRLIDLGNGSIASLGSEFSSLGDSIDRLDENSAQKVGGVALSILSLGQLEGRHIGEARAEIEALDAALVNLVNTKGPEAAAAALQQLADSGQITSAELETLKGQLPGYTDALAGIANESKNAAGASDPLARLLGASGDAARDAANGLDAGATAAQRFADAVSDLNDLLNNRATLRDYEQALDDLNKSVKDNGNVWDVTGAKGRANLQQLDGLVGTSIERINKLRESGHQLAAQKMLTRALGDLEAFRDANPRARAAMQPLFAELRKLDGTKATAKLDAEDAPARKRVNGVQGLLRELNGEKAVPKIDADEAAAMAGIGRVQGGLNSLPSQKTITITTVYNQVGRFLGVPAKADGGYIRGPGTTTSDSIPALLSDKEYVIKAAAVDHYGVDFMNRINAMRFAEGGWAGGDWRDYYNPPGSTHSSSSSNRLSDNAIDRQVNALLASLNGLTAGLHGLSKKEINIRERDLERTEKQLDRLLDKREERAKKEADADKARLESMIETQRAFEEQVAGLFKSDVFGKGESTSFARFPDGSFIDLGKDINSLTPEDYLSYQERGATIEADSGIGDAAGDLTSDISRIRESLRLYQELRAKGFDGPAFRELVGAADVETLAAYAEMSRAELNQIEKLYGQRDQLAGQAGNLVGKDFNADIKGLRKDYQESIGIYRNVLQENKQINRRLDSIEKVLNRAPKETGAEVGAAVGGAINSAVSDAGRGRGR